MPTGGTSRIFIFFFFSVCFSHPATSSAYSSEMYRYKNSKQVLQVTTLNIKDIQVHVGKQYLRCSTFTSNTETVIQVNDIFRAESFNWGLQSIFILKLHTSNPWSKSTFFFSERIFLYTVNHNVNSANYSLELQILTTDDGMTVMQLPLELQINHRWWYDS